MKQTMTAILYLSAALLLITHPLHACSSFAVYGERPIYGMNFDYAKFPMKFLIWEKDGIRTFHLAFQRPVAGKMIWACTGGMNDQGLFAACQEELPYAVNPPRPKEGEIYVHQLYMQLGSHTETAEIEAICNIKKLIQLEAVSVHNLFADKHGGAVITEATPGGNRLVKIKDKFIVMTNFPNRSMEGKNFREAKGTGDKRYIMAHEFLTENQDGFDSNAAMNLLEKIRIDLPEYATACSMVFDPLNNEILIAVKQNYNKIYKVSLKNNTVETLRGFNNYQKADLDSEGILLSSLVNWN